MEFSALLRIVGDEPVFETGLLLAGHVHSRYVRKQLSLWNKSGRVYQLRRGLYALAPPFQKAKPHPFVVANRMVHGSYVSLQSALAHYGLIPESVPVTTSVSTGRSRRWDTPLGGYEFRHIKADLLFGYRLLDLGLGQHATIATPEKALLDLIHLEPGGNSPDHYRELRLQHLHTLRVDELRRLAALSGSPKLIRAAVFVADLARVEAREFVSP
jgi:predicted transcriptional regulator of viral defense system